jgi:hypothetical protein
MVSAAMPASPTTGAVPMKQSSLVVLCAFVAVSLSACGASVCDRINAAQDRFFAGKTECKATSGSSTITLTRGGTCSDTSKCTADELKTLDTYASCVTSAQACSTGNESKAASDLTACALAVVGKLSTTCSAAIK